ncbi:hypothetical protein Sste5346_005850 [Sporothrix stenoceras]|uniref:Uncharacterized protein n=1 Tax=Sporothrix stenoceras TaxID=5173 RepID=A0ABR3Z143_9PEZI
MAKTAIFHREALRSHHFGHEHGLRHPGRHHSLSPLQGLFWSSPASSSSASPSTSTAPPAPPTCNTNLLTNGDFSNNINYWTITGNYAATIDGCGPYSNCMDMYFGSGSVQISQSFDTQAGTLYSISFGYYAAVNAGAAFTCNIIAGDNLENGVTIASFSLALALTTWELYGDVFHAAAGTTKTTVACVVTSDSFTQFELMNLKIAIPCWDGVV